MSSIKSDGSESTWSKYAKVYDPIKCASIDGTDEIPHDCAVEKAIKSTYKPNRFVKGRPGCTIFVSRLSHSTTKDTIKELFSKYGKLKRFRMVKDIVTGIPKGYAFVEYEEEKDAETAYKFANRMKVDGQCIFVDFECERLLKGWKPRRLGGGFGGKKESGQLRFGGRDRPFRKPISLELEDKRRREKRHREETTERRYRERSRNRHETSKKRPLSRSHDNTDTNNHHKIRKVKTPPTRRSKPRQSTSSSSRSFHSEKRTRYSPHERSRSPRRIAASSKKQNSSDRSRYQRPHHRNSRDTDTSTKSRERESPLMENMFYIKDQYSASSTPQSG